MTIQKEHLELYKREKQKDLADVDSIFVVENKKLIDQRVENYRKELMANLNYEVALQKASINGEIAAIDSLIAKANEPEVVQQ